MNATRNARRRRAHYAVAPVTRAIRAALAMSAALALSAPGVAFAQSCTHDAFSNRYLCDGAFTETAATGAFVPPIVDDLTLVLGSLAPTSVIPAAGAMGVDAAWGGDVSVITSSGTSILTSGADGIHLYSADGAASLANFGRILTGVTAVDAGAIDIEAVDDVTLVNGGVAQATDASGDYDVTAARAISTGGDISIDNQWSGELGASAFSGDAIGLSANAQHYSSALTIDNAGVINADSVYGDAIGISAVSGGSATVINGGDVLATTQQSASDSTPIYYTDKYGNPYIGGYQVNPAYATGIDVQSGIASVANTGNVIVDAGLADGGAELRATGVKVMGRYGASVDNDGTVSVTATAGAGGFLCMRGIDAFGGSDGVSVTNGTYGDVSVSAQADGGTALVHALYVFGYGGATSVDNAGDISAVADGGYALATGINAVGYGYGAHVSEVVNTGTIRAVANGDDNAYAFGIFNLTRQRYGDASLDNAGDIQAHASGTYATATGALNLALRYGDATTINSGSIEAIADGVSGATATGLYSQAQVYNAILSNSGTVSATATATRAIAVGINVASSLYGNTYLHNAGAVDAHAYADTGFARAAGIVATAENAVELTNDVGATVDVIARADGAAASAVGLYASGAEVASVFNDGDVSALAENTYGGAYAYGALVSGGYAGIGLLVNGGNIDAVATAGPGAYAYAYGAFVLGDVASAFNDAHLAATATAIGGQANAIGARAYGAASAVANYGELIANADAIGGVANATGAYVFGYIGADARNDGTLSVHASGDTANATGVVNISIFGTATATNGGVIDVNADGALEAGAIGLYNYALLYDSVVDNSGTILATAHAGGVAGDPAAVGQAYAIGIQAVNAYGGAPYGGQPYGTARIVNGGDLQVSASVDYGYAWALGAVAQALPGAYGVAAIDNAGSISSVGHADIGGVNATGAYAVSYRGTSIITNSGDVVVSGRAESGEARATGTYALSFGFGSRANVDNTGTIQANAFVSDQSYGGVLAEATGIKAFSTSGSTITNAGTVGASATAYVDWYGGASAAGIFAYGYYGAAVTNDGSVTADASAIQVADDNVMTAAEVVGIAAMAGRPMFGSTTTTLVNHGDVSATAVTDASGYWAGVSFAYGAIASGKYTTVDNSGRITGTAETTAGVAAAYGARVFGSGSGGSTDVSNAQGALIGAYATSATIDGEDWGGNAFANAIRLVGSGAATHDLYNGGEVVAHATVLPGAGGIDATVNPGVARAYGVYVSGNFGMQGTVVNAGSIEAIARADYGVAVAYGSELIGGATGSTSNTGTIFAGAYAASGIAAFATGSETIARGDTGVATLDNSGTIGATALGGDASATGASVVAGYSSSIYNTGTIQANAGGANGATVFGASAAASQLVYFTNAGTGIIDASAVTQDGAAVAFGAYANGALGSDPYYGIGGGGTTVMLNDGDIAAHAESTNGSAYAYAGYVYGGFVGIGLLVNGGDLVADASAGAESAAIATGASVLADVATIFNDHAISASATAGTGGLAMATGARAGLPVGSGSGVYAAYAAIYSDGDLAANAIADGGTAVAIGADSSGYFGSRVVNGGNLLVGARADGGTAVASGVVSAAYFGISDVTNGGSIGVAADGTTYASATGVDSYGYYGAITNAGDIEATAVSSEGVSVATGVSSVGLVQAYATNTGSISAGAAGAQANATGLLNVSVLGAITYNEGSISAVADGTLAPYGEYEAVAFGVYNMAVYYDSVVDNSGSISASASATTDISGTDGFLVAKALGALAQSVYGYGYTVVSNAASITATAETSQGYAGAWGAVSLAGPYGSAWVENDGSIAAFAKTDVGAADALGAYVTSLAGASAVINNGDIVASAESEQGIPGVSLNFSSATGARVISAAYGAGEAVVANYGSIEAHSSVLAGIGYAYGVDSYGLYNTLTNAAGASIVATAEAERFGGVYTTAVRAAGVYGVDVLNDGGIVAYSHANASVEDDGTHIGVTRATGINADASIFGDVSVVNHGDVTAASISDNSISYNNGGARALGIHTYSRYDSDVVNTGRVTAIASSEFGPASAYGVDAQTKYAGSISNAAGASIVAYASSGSLDGDDNAGRAFSTGMLVWGRFGVEQGVLYNAGSVVSHAVVRPEGGENLNPAVATAFGAAVGGTAQLNVDNADVVNVGSVEAAASADFGYASAYGTWARARDVASVTNGGDVRAMASAANGNAFAVGSYAFGEHQTYVLECNDDGCDYDNAYWVTDGGTSSLGNTGNIVATANAHGGTGYSYGTVAIGAFGVATTNAGHITAVTHADDATAIGSLVNSEYGDALLDNSGAIVAAAYGTDATATAVAMLSHGSNTLTNTGTIAAFGDGTRIAISAMGGATTIANTGAITGAIATGDLDDRLDNAAGGTWIALGESNFGAGTNAIANAGTVVMDDAAILLGADVATNAFANAGSMFVWGAHNAIGAGSFSNDGTISFVDGAADDMLAITGDFSGEGAIHLDVSGLHQASDRLYVDGNVAGTTQTLDVTLVDLPTGPSGEIVLAHVAGEATADNFVLGNVAYRGNGFTSMAFGLQSRIAAADAEFFLGVNVTGLNDMGSIAAALAPGAQRLVDAQVGTWRQRMGVVPGPSDSGLAPWIRGFSDSGDVDTDQTTNLGPGGDFDFDQSSHGWEMGLDARPTDHVAVGVLFADSSASQHLKAGSGSTRLDGKTFGLYATWFSDVFYLDVSQRWIGFDARLQAVTGQHTTDVSASAFNVEAGYTGWSYGDFRIVPQAQYTRTEVADVSPMDNGQSTFVVEGGKSSRGRLGVALDTTFDRGAITWTPYGSLNAVHEFDGEYGYKVDQSLFGTTRTGGTSAMVELGVGMRTGKWSVTGGVNWLDGGALEGIGGGQLTVRYSW